jgi:hypothetical protein
MSADRSRPSHHRDQDTATSAVARAGASDARGRSPAVDTPIDEGRAFLVWHANTDTRQAIVRR